MVGFRGAWRAFVAHGGVGGAWRGWGRMAGLGTHGRVGGTWQGWGRMAGLGAHGRVGGAWRSWGRRCRRLGGQVQAEGGKGGR